MHRDADGPAAPVRRIRRLPGVVKGGTVITAPNLGDIGRVSSSMSWPAPALVRVLNDAAVHGAGSRGHGLARHHARHGLAAPTSATVARSCTGARAERPSDSTTISSSDRRHWTIGPRRGICGCAIGPRDYATHTCDVLYIGGGNARKITFALPAQADREQRRGWHWWCGCGAELDELFR
jgi:hypothetical protein